MVSIGGKGADNDDDDDDITGLMMYSGQMADGSGDFVSLGMRNRRAEFRLDIGSGPAVIASDPLELDRWHTARIRRDRRDGTVICFCLSWLSFSYKLVKMVSVCGRVSGC